MRRGLATLLTLGLLFALLLAVDGGTLKGFVHLGSFAGGGIATRLGLVVIAVGLVI